MNFIVVQGVDPGPFFKFKNGNLLTKVTVTQHVRAALQTAGIPNLNLLGTVSELGQYNNS